MAAIARDSNEALCEKKFDTVYMIISHSSVRGVCVGSNSMLNEPFCDEVCYCA